MEEAVSCVSVNKQFYKRLQFYVLEVHRTCLWDKVPLKNGEHVVFLILGFNTLEFSVVLKCHTVSKNIGALRVLEDTMLGGIFCRKMENFIGERIKFRDEELHNLKLLLATNSTVKPKKDEPSGSCSMIYLKTLSA